MRFSGFHSVAGDCPDFPGRFSRGTQGGFHVIYSSLFRGNNRLKTNLSVIKSQQKQRIKVQKARLHTLFYAGKN